MDVTIDDSSETVRIHVGEPRIDAAIAGEFKDKLRPFVAGEGRPVAIDLAAVQFLDSSGLGALIALRKTMAEGRGLVLTGLTPNVERVFKLTHMDRIFDVRLADGEGR